MQPRDSDRPPSVSGGDWKGRLEPPPEPPELPEALSPRWPAWYAPVALISSFFAISFLAAPLLPLFLLQLVEPSGDVSASVLLIAILVQDAVLVGVAILFAIARVRPARAWHFGLRATPLLRTAGWAALAAALTFGFEIGYFELIDAGDAGVDDLVADEGLLGAIALALAVIVVAPATEEIFFRAFFYRALRSRLRVLPAALIDGTVFSLLHFQGTHTAATLPVIAFFGLAVCLVYERTGSVFAVIAIHAAFNTFATVVMAVETDASVIVPLAIGLAMIAACLLVPRRLGPGPSPLRGSRRRRLRGPRGAEPAVQPARAPSAA